MLFDQNSALAKIWAGLVIEGKYTREQIPNLSNLREVVLSLLGE